MGTIQHAEGKKVFVKAALLAGLVLGSEFSPAWAWHPSEVEMVWRQWARSVYTREHIPYFALHPPVYYTMPVGRPYGYCPFAYPGWVPAAQIEPPRPMVILNPYMVGFGGRSASQVARCRLPSCPHTAASELEELFAPGVASDQTSRPIRIVNPYYRDTVQKEGVGISLETVTGELISSTASVQPRRIRNPFVAEDK